MSIDLGRVMPVPKGAYDVTTAYTRLDIVTSGNSSYMCLVSNTGKAVTDATYWLLLAKAGSEGKPGDTGPQGPKGDKGDPGPAGSTGPIGPQGQQGEKGDTGADGVAGKDGVGASVDLTPYAKKTEVIPSNLVSLEINAGATFDTPFIDFHTKTGVNDYDARIIVAGGKSGAVGQANMNIVANGGVIINGKKVATVDQINPWNSITDKGHDLNTVITDGRYWCKATMGNAPVATWGYLYVNSADPARVQQDFVSDTTAEKYIRMKFGDSWTAWRQVTLW